MVLDASRQRWARNAGGFSGVPMTVSTDTKEQSERGSPPSERSRWRRLRTWILLAVAIPAMALIGSLALPRLARPRGQLGPQRRDRSDHRR